MTFRRGKRRETERREYNEEDFGITYCCGRKTELLSLRLVYGTYAVYGSGLIRSTAVLAASGFPRKSSDHDAEGGFIFIFFFQRRRRRRPKSNVSTRFVVDRSGARVVK